jgi:sugar/nucleoside kinase (ribokinase family)
MSHRPVLIVGSLAFDDVLTPVGAVKNALGGSAAYSGIAASFFHPVELVGVVGGDYPKEFLDYLASRKIDTAGVEIVPGGKTFHWSGHYDFDLNIAHTLDTELGVFGTFKPKLPASYKDAEYVFLANIQPDLQLDVLNQITSPKLVVCDTMNYWIDSMQDALWEVLKRVDIAFLNDAEARQLTGKMSTIAAAKAILAKGPKLGVIVKKGEHGALMFTQDGGHFSAPSYPIEEIADPTGAGDSFAGGFIGYVASKGNLLTSTLRLGIIHGSVMASYNVEDFSMNRMRKLTPEEIHTRYREFQRIAHFEPVG